MPILDKPSHGKCVFIRISTSEPLVCHIEKREVTGILHGLADLNPLLLRRVDSGRVMGAGVEEDNAALGSRLDVGEHALEVQANGLLIIVAVLLDLEPRILEHGGMVRPRRGGNVDGLGRVGVEAFEKGAADTKGTGAGDGLRDGDAVFL